MNGRTLIVKNAARPDPAAAGPHGRTGMSLAIAAAPRPMPRGGEDLT